MLKLYFFKKSWEDERKDWLLRFVKVSNFEFNQIKFPALNIQTNNFLFVKWVQEKLFDFLKIE